MSDKNSPSSPKAYPPPPWSCFQWLELFPDHFDRVIGNSDTPQNNLIHRISSPDRAQIGSAVFCSQPKALTQALQSAASVIIVEEKLLQKASSKTEGEEIGSLLDSETSKRTFLICKPHQVELAMRNILRKFIQETPYRDHNFTSSQNPHHPSAVIHPTAQIAADAEIAPLAVIGANCIIGSQVYIGSQTVIEENVHIGDGSVIHPLVYIGHHTQIGRRCEIMPHTVIGKEGFGYAVSRDNKRYRIPHVGIVIIEDDVHIGSGCTIDRGSLNETLIREGTKMDNQIHISHNCHIGARSTLTAKFAVAGSSKIGNDFLSGGNATVTGHINITDGVQLAGMSVVSKDITTPGAYAGFPLVPLKENIRIRGGLLVLPEMRENIKKLMKKVFGDNANSD